MSTEARVMPMTAPDVTTGKGRRGRRTSSAKEVGEAIVMFFLGERGNDGSLLLTEQLESEGAAMLEALKRSTHYFRVETWKTNAVVKDGSVEIRKQPVTGQK